MKKTLLIGLLIFFIFLLIFFVWRRRAIKSGRWQRLQQETPATQITPSPTPAEVSPEEAALDKDLEKLDEMMGGLDPQKEFQDMPDEDVGF